MVGKINESEMPDEDVFSYRIYTCSWKSYPISGTKISEDVHGCNGRHCKIL